MESERRSQVVRERIHRHNRLMRMIKNYTRTDEQNRKLQKIKMNTMMEINIRYLRSDHNRHYRFPFSQEIDSPEEFEEEIKDPYINKKQLIVYDLFSQNTHSPSKSPTKKTLSLDNSRRIVSLELDRHPEHRERLLRLNLKGKHQLSNKLLTRKNSLNDKLRREPSKIRLPQLQLNKNREVLKTEARAEEENQIHQVVGKKLLTETSEGRIKLQGVEKYLRRAQRQGQRPSFKKRVLLPDRLN